LRMTLDPDLAAEAKHWSFWLFATAPSKPCTPGNHARSAAGKADVSHLSDHEMKAVMKSAVDTLYRLLWQRDYDPAAYREALAFGRRNTLQWNDPDLQKPSRRGSRTT